MRAVRRTAEEQYRLILECRKSGLSDCDWCRENGINLETFYTWITRLKKRGGFPVPPASKLPANSPPHDIVRVDVLPEGTMHKLSDNNNALIPGREIQTSGSVIEIAAQGVTFRFSGTVDAFLYEKTLRMLGGLL